MNRISFRSAEIDLFRSISGDDNPVHWSSTFTRATHFGNPIVHGMYAVVRCLDNYPEFDLSTYLSVDIHFKDAIFVDHDYSCVWSDNHEAAECQLLDGKREVFRMCWQRASGRFNHQDQSLSNARARAKHGGLISGWREFKTTQIRNLVSSSSRSNNTVGIELLSHFFAMSYLIGMESPGAGAVISNVHIAFTSLFSEDDDRRKAPVVDRFRVRYEVGSEEHDERFRMTSANAIFESDAVASQAKWRAFKITEEAYCLSGSSEVKANKTYAGQVVVIFGGSRGLGASLSQKFLEGGATVYCVYKVGHKHLEKHRLWAQANELDLRLRQGDISELSFCVALCDEIKMSSGGVDLMCLTASPALLSYGIEEVFVDRIAKFVSHSFALALNPLLIFLELVEIKSGAVVILSSSIVNRPEKAWPHYSASKKAIEGLTEVVAMGASDVNFLMVRPSRMRTGLTNTPMGHMDAMDCDNVANQILHAVVLMAEAESSNYHIYTPI